MTQSTSQISGIGVSLGRICPFTALESHIKSKDVEIELLKSDQKRQLSLIEELTYQKKQVVAREKLVQEQQKELVEKLSNQKRNIREMEKQYALTPSCDMSPMSSRQRW